MPVPKGYKLVEIHKWTNEEKEYLKEICFGRSRKEIMDLMSKKFDYEFSIIN